MPRLQRHFWNKQLTDPANVALYGSDTTMKELIDTMWNSGIYDRRIFVNVFSREHASMNDKKIKGQIMNRLYTARTIKHPIKMTCEICKVSWDTNRMWRCYSEHKLINYPNGECAVAKNGYERQVIRRAEEREDKYLRMGSTKKLDEYKDDEILDTQKYKHEFMANKYISKYLNKCKNIVSWKRLKGAGTDWYYLRVHQADNALEITYKAATNSSPPLKFLTFHETNEDYHRWYVKASEGFKKSVTPLQYKYHKNGNPSSNEECGVLLIECGMDRSKICMKIQFDRYGQKMAQIVDFYAYHLRNNSLPIQYGGGPGGDFWRGGHTVCVGYPRAQLQHPLVSKCISSCLYNILSDTYDRFGEFRAAYIANIHEVLVNYRTKELDKLCLDEVLELEFVAQQKTASVASSSLQRTQLLLPGFIREIENTFNYGERIIRFNRPVQHYYCGNPVVLNNKQKHKNYIDKRTSKVDRFGYGVTYVYFMDITDSRSFAVFKDQKVVLNMYNIFSSNVWSYERDNDLFIYVDEKLNDELSHIATHNVSPEDSVTLNDNGYYLRFEQMSEFFKTQDIDKKFIAMEQVMEMGFDNTNQVLSALKYGEWDVERALDMLLNFSLMEGEGIDIPMNEQGK
eukprot:151192_1